MRLNPVVLWAFCVFVAVPVYGQEGSPAGAVPPRLLAQRRALLLDRIGEGVVILRANRVQDREGEDFPQATDFRQDDDFFYLTGLESPDAWLVLVAHEQAPDQTILYVPARDEAQEQWTGPRLDTRAAGALAGITDVRTNDLLAADVAGMIKPATSLYVKVPEAVSELCAGLPETRDAECKWLYLRPLQPVPNELRDVRPQLAALRLIKDAEELRRMRRAIDITTDALKAAMQHARPGDWEYQIEAGLEQVFHSSGAERVGFPTIVGSGPNSTVLHYDKSRRQTRAGDLVVMDIGAEFGYYTADVTRTMPISGHFTERQRAVYDLVLGAQQAALDSIRPGITLPRLDDIAREYMQRHSGRVCGARSCDEYFIHAIGHWLGMDVHDPGSLTTPLEPGMVVTVEPGIYLADEALGVRIEDDVLVTATGHEMLSTGAPRSAEEIEKLMNRVSN